jgi:hypothetical protein
MEQTMQFDGIFAGRGSSRRCDSDRPCALRRAVNGVTSPVWRTFAVACFLASATKSAHAVEVLDQHYDDFVSAIGDTASHFSQEVGQTFTVGVGGVLTRIEVLLARFPFTSDSAVLHVYDSAADLPDTLLGSATVSSALISTTAPTFVSFDVSSFAIPVNVDEVMSFGIESDTGGTYILPYPLSGMYGGGSSVRRTLSVPPGPWQFQAGRDYGFRTYVDAAAGPLLPGDYNGNDVVDAADYTLWRDHLGANFALTNENPDAVTPGEVDEEDYTFWADNFGAMPPGSGMGIGPRVSAVPEPASIVLLLGLACLRQLVPRT